MTPTKCVGIEIFLRGQQSVVLGRTSGLLKSQAAGIASLVGRKVKHIQVESAETTDQGTKRIIRYLDAWEKPVG